MSIVTQGAAAPAARINVWIASGLGALGVILPLFAGGSQGFWIIPVSLVLPAIGFAMMLATPEAFGVTRRGKRSLNIMPGLSIIGLLVSGTTNASLLDWRPALVPAAFAAAIALVLGVGLVGRRLPGPLWASILFWVVFGAGYGFCGTVFADRRLDHDPTQNFPVVVQRQYLSYGKNSTTPHLVLAPWGPATGETDVAVTRAAYQALTPGQTACVTLHPGALNMPWFEAGLCSAGG
jgi:hypothetical protein